MKKKKISPFEATWMDLQNNIFFKSEKDKYSITYTWNLKIIQMNLYTK